MGHALKILVKILQYRINRLSEVITVDEQFGFRMCTRDALFRMHTLLKKAIEFHKNVYICFIELEKVLNRIPRHIYQIA